MELTEEWFTRFGSLKLNIGDGDTYRYELFTTRCVFRGARFVESKEIALDDLYADVKHMLWFNCHNVERERSQ